MIKAIIVAESALARRGIEQLLHCTEVEIVASVASFSALDAGLDQRISADVLVSSGDSPQIESLLESLADADLELPLVLLAEPLDPEITEHALRLGARAVLPAELPRPQLLAALQAVAQGLVVVTPAETDAVLSASQTNGPSATPPTSLDSLLEPLTARELQVLRLLALGLANKEIASRLSISEHTAKFHVAAILGKLGAASRAEAVALGIRHGLILL